MSKDSNANMKKVGLAGAVFIMASGLFDYIIDEVTSYKKYISNHKSQILFKTYGPRLALPSINDIIEYQKKLTDRRELFLIYLTIVFSIICRSISSSGTSRTWKDLSHTIFRLYDVEKKSYEVNEHKYKRSLAVNELVSLSRSIKSSLPSTVMYLVSKMASSSSCSDEKENMIKSMCNTLGDIFWIADDPSDVISDTRSGNVNSITMHLVKNKILEDISNLCQNLIPHIEKLLSLIEFLKKKSSALFSRSYTRIS